MNPTLEQILTAIDLVAADVKMTLQERNEAMEKIGCRAFDTADRLKVEIAQSKKPKTPA